MAENKEKVIYLVVYSFYDIYEVHGAFGAFLDYDAADKAAHQGNKSNKYGYFDVEEIKVYDSVEEWKAEYGGYLELVE